MLLGMHHQVVLLRHDTCAASAVNAPHLWSAQLWVYELVASYQRDAQLSGNNTAPAADLQQQQHSAAQHSTLQYHTVQCSSWLATNC